MTRLLAVLFAGCVAFWPGAVLSQGIDHTQHQHGAEPSPPPTGAPAPVIADGPDVQADHAEHHHDTAAELPSFIAPPTAADRQAAFPEVHAHAAHDNGTHAYILLDEFEWQRGGRVDGLVWGGRGWVGRDLDRLWFRTEGATGDGRADGVDAHVLYGRAFARWWDVVAGIRQEVRPGSPQTWAAVGVQGLAPYRFQLAATAYIGASARTSVRLEAEYEWLLTNRLILKPLFEVDVQGRSDRDRGIGAGLSSADAGLRVRYEFRREVAPYVGLVWHRTFFGTADAARANGATPGGVRFVSGLRVWM